MLEQYRGAESFFGGSAPLDEVLHYSLPQVALAHTRDLTRFGCTVTQYVGYLMCVVIALVFTVLTSAAVYFDVRRFLPFKNK